MVIFLAFANDRDNTLLYLRNLRDEARRLREELEAAEKADLCEVVVRTNCTAEDIFKVFQDPQYRKRITIFHYGGHANGYQLLLESASGQAVGDPLFGLPPLPQQYLPESPYRHLNWFTRKDAEVFFGRGHQIRELYDRLTAPHTAPIMLFYGQSGVGKSSLLDAGLIPRLERDYEVRYLRRSDRGLLETLQSVFVADVTESGLDTAWRDQEEKSGKPLIVFLEQVEEIFTRPAEDAPDEMVQFIQALKVIFDDPKRRPKGKLMLGFRKEWLGELEAHLASHELPRSKVFLQSLDRRGVIEVVRGTTKSKRLRDRYGLSVGDDLPEIIADDLIEDRDSAITPTLQILEDR